MIKETQIKEIQQNHLKNIQKLLIIFVKIQMGLILLK